MKTVTLALLALQACLLNACIVVHSSLEHCGGPTNLIMGTSYHVDAEMYDNGRMVCAGAWNKRTQSSDWFPIQCDPGYTLEISPSGAIARMRSPNGYSATMGTAHQKRYKLPGCDIRPGGREPKDVDGTMFEACFYDKYPNCNDFQGCETCGHTGAGSCRTRPVNG